MSGKRKPTRQEYKILLYSTKGQGAFGSSDKFYPSVTGKLKATVEKNVVDSGLDLAEPISRNSRKKGLRILMRVSIKRFT